MEELQRGAAEAIFPRQQAWLILEVRLPLEDRN